MVESNAVQSLRLLEVSRETQDHWDLWPQVYLAYVSVLTHDQQLIQIGWSYRCYGIAVR